MSTTIIRRVRACVLHVVTFLATATVQATPGSGPSLMITYRVTPAQRVVLQQELQKLAAGELRRRQADGMLTGYRLLFSRYADAQGWDAMALLTFRNDHELGRWKEVERSRPAGLSARALAATTEIRTDAIESIRQQGSAPPAGHSVFLVIPYKVLVSRNDYLKYADGYVLPQFAGWMEEGVLSRYSVYSNLYSAGRAWNTMIVLEYKDDDALGRREAVVTKVRERLQDDPTWKAISQDKKEVRVELHPVIADSL
ncbi:MAG TPA: hypothetical protein VJ743_08810 [Albitalea sp.]|nr:hypothetical protein [Albitalea sp.]